MSGRAAAGFRVAMVAPSREPAVHTYAALIAAAARRLRDAGIDAARLDAEVLVSAAAGLSRTGVFARLPEAVPATVESRLESLLARRCAREPLAYVTGEKEFYSLPMAVSPAVLIPRPETELAVETALRHLPPAGLAVDVGTGSGCIAVALAVERPDIRVLAIDDSPAALAVAAANIGRHGVGARVHLARGDLLAPLRTAPIFDVIVANPPYVADGAALAPELAFEPAAALRAGADGMRVIERLLPQAIQRLRCGGRLVLEFGSDQERAVRAAAAAAGFAEVDILRDLAGYPRVAVLPTGRKADSSPS